MTHSPQSNHEQTGFCAGDLRVIQQLKYHVTWKNIKTYLSRIFFNPACPPITSKQWLSFTNFILRKTLIHWRMGIWNYVFLILVQQSDVDDQTCWAIGYIWNSKGGLWDQPQHDCHKMAAVEKAVTKSWAVPTVGVAVSKWVLLVDSRHPLGLLKHFLFQSSRGKPQFALCSGGEAWGYHKTLMDTMVTTWSLHHTKTTRRDLALLKWSTSWYFSWCPFCSHVYLQQIFSCPQTCISLFVASLLPLQHSLSHLSALHPLVLNSSGLHKGFKLYYY